MKLFMKTVTLRQTKKEIEWAEFSYRTVFHKTGYRVTLSAIVIPSMKIVVAGASACSPEDAHMFDRRLAADRALGRARQVATWLLTAKNDNWREKDTLLGWGGTSIFKWLPDQEEALPESLRIQLIDRTIMHAIDQAVEKTMEQLRKMQSPVAKRLVTMMG